MSDDLQQQLEELSKNLSSFRSSTSDQLGTEIAKAIQASEEQHVRTRAIISEAKTDLTSEIQNIQSYQEQARSRREQKQRSQLQRQNFLESLFFHDTNRRMNEIEESHRDTFHWIFDEDPSRPWDSFTTWLKGDKPVYWIRGKPGSGKSTLMKFLANASQTRDFLREWYPNDEVLVVTYYFWLSGNHIQRSLKGFLLSIIRQVIINEEGLLDTLLGEHPSLLAKRNIHDWDIKELRELLVHLTGAKTLPLFCFIDGLDEFDQRDDVDSLLSLIKKISSAGKTKFCVSSRPDKYLWDHLSKHPQLQLQDLTAADMQILIRDRLAYARSTCSPASVGQQRYEDIVEIMSQRADGVFLWVRYAIESIITGMRNVDNFSVLLNRVEELPSGMHQLYLQMWNRLNDDQQRYRDEASIYFSYCLLPEPDHEVGFGSISLFEMVVALSESLQRMYIDREFPQSHVNVAEQCELLGKQLWTRCAGLLEIVIDHENDYKYCTQYRRLEWEDSHSPIQRMSMEGHLLNHQKSKIKFMHRTARDFVLDCAGGRSLLGQPKESLSLRWQNLTRARMVVKLQGLELFQSTWVYWMMYHVSFNCQVKEVEFLKFFKCLCERLSIPNTPSHNIAYQSFWVSGVGESDFDSTAASAGCARYIQHLLQRRESCFSPYYRGSLIMSTMNDLHFDDNSGADKLSMVSWLISSGADLRTKHLTRSFVEDVVLSILSVFHYAQQHAWMNDQYVKQAGGVIEQLMMALANSDYECLVWVSRDADWLVLRSLWQRDRDMSEMMMVRASATYLCWRSLQLLHLAVSCEKRWSQPPPIIASQTQVLFYQDDVDRAGHALDSEESLSLGQMLDEIWSVEPNSSVSRRDLNEDLDKKLREVEERGPKVRFEDWATENGYRFERDGFIYTLDPSEDVDESNWMQKGYFRKYDARDEFHRSPEKLKMMERMQEKKRRQEAKPARYRPSQITRSNNVTGAPQPGPSD